MEWNSLFTSGWQPFVAAAALIALLFGFHMLLKLYIERLKEKIFSLKVQRYLILETLKRQNKNSN